jgi:hypothetical protein
MPDDPDPSPTDLLVEGETSRGRADSIAATGVAARRRSAAALAAPPAWGVSLRLFRPLRMLVRPL